MNRGGNNRYDDYDVNSPEKKKNDLNDSNVTAPLEKPEAYNKEKGNNIDDLFDSDDEKDKDNKVKNHNAMSNFNIFESKNEILGKSPFEDSAILDNVAPNNDHNVKSSQINNNYEPISNSDQIKDTNQNNNVEVSNNSLFLDNKDIEHLNKIIMENNSLNNHTRQKNLKDNNPNLNDRLLEKSKKYKEEAYKMKAISQNNSNLKEPNKLPDLANKSLNIGYKDSYDVEIAAFNNISKNSGLSIQLESIFFSKNQHAKSTSPNNFPCLIDLQLFFFQNLDSPYLGDVDIESISAENLILFQEESLKLRQYFEDQLNFVNSISLDSIVTPKVNFLKKSEAVNYIREVLNDGNSFYRALIYKLLEDAVLEGNLTFLNKVFYNLFFRYYKSYPKSIRYKCESMKMNLESSILRIIIFFSQLIDLVSKGNIKTSIEYMVKSWLLIEEIDKVMVAYVRFVIIDFTTINFDAILSCDFVVPEINQSDEIKPLMYIRGDADYNYNELLNDVSYMHIEPCYFVMYVAAYAFNCNISLICLNEGGILDIFNICCTRSKNNATSDRNVILVKNNLYNSIDIDNTNGALGFNIGYSIDITNNHPLFSFAQTDVSMLIPHYELHLVRPEIGTFLCKSCGNTNPNSKFYTRQADMIYLMLCDSCIVKLVKKSVFRRAKFLKSEKFYQTECKIIIRLLIRLF